jgi:general secretion pathway protein H
LSLELEGLPGSEDNLLSQLDWQLEDAEQAETEAEIPVLPQVFILSSGEISPFQLVLIENSDLTPLFSAVSTDFAIPLNRTAVSAEQP